MMRIRTRIPPSLYARSTVRPAPLKIRPSEWRPARWQSTVHQSASSEVAGLDGTQMPKERSTSTRSQSSRTTLDYTKDLLEQSRTSSQPWTNSIRESADEADLATRQSTCTISLDGKDISFDPVFLRDSCTCSTCVDPSTSQKQFCTVDIPTDIEVNSIETNASGAVLTWRNDTRDAANDHTTHLSYDFLRQAIAPQRKLADPSASQTTWDQQMMHKNLNIVDYNDYMSHTDARDSALRSLHHDGLVFLKNVPESEQAVVDVGTRIGPLKNTFYGLTWDVRSIPNAKNVAYTHQHLGFHMDLLYMHQPPRLQLLHCLRASPHGGASLFSDSYHAIQHLYQHDRETFDTLCTHDTSFHYDNDGHQYHQSRPTVQLRPSIAPTTSSDNIAPAIEAVNWSPPFQGPFLSHSGQYATGGTTHNMRKWHAAATKFRDLVESPTAVFERQMAPGECVIFDNRRVLHARTAFELGDVGRERWLKGAYLDWDPYASMLRGLERRRAGGGRGGKVVV